jgi:hypothetical protein
VLYACYVGYIIYYIYVMRHGFNNRGKGGGRKMKEGRCRKGDEGRKEGRRSWRKEGGGRKMKGGRKVEERRWM